MQSAQPAQISIMTPTANRISLNELDSIMQLQRQEAFDDDGNGNGGMPKTRRSHQQTKGHERERDRDRDRDSERDYNRGSSGKERSERTSRRRGSMIERGSTRDKDRDRDRDRDRGRGKKSSGSGSSRRQRSLSAHRGEVSARGTRSLDDAKERIARMASESASGRDRDKDRDKDRDRNRNREKDRERGRDREDEKREKRGHRRALSAAPSSDDRSILKSSSSSRQKHDLRSPRTQYQRTKDYSNAYSDDADSAVSSLSSRMHRSKPGTSTSTRSLSSYAAHATTPLNTSTHSALGTRRKSFRHDPLVTPGRSPRDHTRQDLSIAPPLTAGKSPKRSSSRVRDVDDSSYHRSRSASKRKDKEETSRDKEFQREIPAHLDDTDNRSVDKLNQSITDLVGDEDEGELTLNVARQYLRRSQSNQDAGSGDDSQSRHTTSSSKSSKSSKNRSSKSKSGSRNSKRTPSSHRSMHADPNDDSLGSVISASNGNDANAHSDFEDVWDHPQGVVSPRSLKSGGRQHRKTSSRLTRSDSDTHFSEFETELDGDDHHEDDSRSHGRQSIASDAHNSRDSKSSSRPPRTKLDKVQYLQAKYEKYKKEWMIVTKEKKYVKKELARSKAEVVALNKEIDTHITETDVLRRDLAESLQKMELVAEGQRREHDDYATVSEELAQVRIDHTKALNEARELKADLIHCEGDLSERDRKIKLLTTQVEGYITKVEDLEIKLDDADDEIRKLEDEIKVMEDELIAYQKATAQQSSESNGKNSHEDKLISVRDEIEAKKLEDQERRLQERQEKLDERIKEFEEERQRHMRNMQQFREEEAADKERDIEKQKEREGERQRMDDEINQRLQDLANDNSALQGRLKSEQLETNVKLKERDEKIAKLQADLANLEREASALESEPNSKTSLQKEVEALRGEIETLREDLEETQRNNGMLEEEIEDLQVSNTDANEELNKMRAEVSELQKQADEWKKKSDEWKQKASEWTEKTFDWKEKAEHWEKLAKEQNPDVTDEAKSDSGGAETAQALFLEAALRKKATTDANTAGAARNWGRLGSMFGKVSDPAAAADDAEDRIKELEEENAAQAEMIRKLQSDMMRRKDEAYEAQKELQSVKDKNSSLEKELELARKLASVAADDM